jgi:hypothetical protein
VPAAAQRRAKPIETVPTLQISDFYRPTINCTPFRLRAPLRPLLRQDQPAALLQRATPGRHCNAHGAIDTSICERGFSLMNLLKTAKRSRMGNELVPIAHADGRVQPGQRRGLERPYIPKPPWMPSLSCGVSSRATDGIRITMSSSQASSRCWKPVGTLSDMYLRYVSILLTKVFVLG